MSPPSLSLSLTLSRTHKQHFDPYELERKESYIFVNRSVIVSSFLPRYIYIHTSIYIYICIYEAHRISFQTFFVWALLLIVHTWNSSPLRSNLLRLQCTCFTVPTTYGRPIEVLLCRACQWPSSRPLSSPQLFHNNSLWA